MTYKPTGKTYELKTYADFMSLSDEQFDMMIPDFKEWRKINKEMTTSVDEIAKALGMDEKAKAEAFKFPEFFTWIDDGKHDATVEVKVITVEK